MTRRTDPTRGSGRGSFKMSRVKSYQEVLKSRWSDWVGSGQEVSTSRGLGRVMTREIQFNHRRSHHHPRERFAFGWPGGKIRRFWVRIRLFQTYRCMLLLAGPAEKSADSGRESAFFKHTAA